VALERLLHEGERCLLVSDLGDVALEDLAPLVDCAPEVMHLAVDLHIHLVEVPFPLAKALHSVHPLAPDIGCKQRAEPVPPMPHRLVADVDPVLGQQILNVPQAQRKPHVHHHNQPDDLGRRVEIAKRAVWLPRSGHCMP